MLNEYKRSGKVEMTSAEISSLPEMRNYAKPQISTALSRLRTAGVVTITGLISASERTPGKGGIPKKWALLRVIDAETKPKNEARTEAVPATVPPQVTLRSPHNDAKPSINPFQPTKDNDVTTAHKPRHDSDITLEVLNAQLAALKENMAHELSVQLSAINKGLRTKLESLAAQADNVQAPDNSQAIKDVKEAFGTFAEEIRSRLVMLKAENDESTRLIEENARNFRRNAERYLGVANIAIGQTNDVSAVREEVYARAFAAGWAACEKHVERKLDEARKKRAKEFQAKIEESQKLGSFNGTPLDPNDPKTEERLKGIIGEIFGTTE